MYSIEEHIWLFVKHLLRISQGCIKGNLADQRC